MTNTTRPDPKLIKRSYGYLFNSGWSLTKIRDATLSDRLLQCPANSLGVAGRSLLWKAALLISEPLRQNASLNASSLLDNLRSYRTQYTNLLAERMRAPDGSYDVELYLPSPPPGSKQPTSGYKPNTATDLETNNPLSLHKENPWKDWFAAVELRKTISQDVERTFPDISFFRDAKVQQQLTNILFLYAATRPDVGYRQGMHELLAPLYFTVDYDALMDRDAADIVDLQEICDQRWVAADAWALFTTVMQSASRWYEWQENPKQSKRASASHFRSHVQLNVAETKGEMKPYVAPIVKTCNEIQGPMLKSVDPVLWRHLQSSSIEPQIYGIRWLRLLFTREFALPDAMKLWDCLFTCDPTLDLAQWICVAMLIRIRTMLMSSDYSGQLTSLLRYPSPPTTPPGVENHIILLLRQAQALQVSPSPATGAAMSMENRNYLNIPTEISEAANHKGLPSRPKTSAGTRGVANDAGHTRQSTSSQLGLPEMFARGLLERGESLGINRTFMSAVSELRRNIPDLAASFVRSPNASEVAFPLEDERPPEERPPWEPRTRFEMEQDIAQLKARDKKLGETLSWVVDALLQDEAGADDKARLAKRKREALESLSYVRDALLGDVLGLEEDRLVGEEERKKRQEKEESKARSQPQQVEVPPPVAAIPIPEPETKTKVNILPTKRQSFQSLSSSSPPRYAIQSTSVPRPQSINTLRPAPWAHTKSGFSGTGEIAGLPSPALPRLPPPTSTALRRPGVAQTSDQTPTSRSPRQDPLGALS